MRETSTERQHAAPLLAPPHAGKIGRNLATIRERVGLTQAQLAKTSKLSRATITLIESGNADPKMSTVHLLAEALGVKVTELID